MTPLAQVLEKIDAAGWGQLAEVARARRLLENPFSLPSARRLVCSELQAALAYIESLQQVRIQLQGLRQLVHTADTEGQLALARVDSHLQHPGGSLRALQRTLEQVRTNMTALEATRARLMSLKTALDALLQQQSEWPESLRSYALPKVERLRQRPPTAESEQQLRELQQTVSTWPRPTALPQPPALSAPVPLPRLQPLALTAASGTRPTTPAPSVELLADCWSKMDPGP